MDVVIGIDPGVQGAIAALDRRGRVHVVEDTATFWVQSGRQRRRAYDTAAMRKLLVGFIDDDGPPHVVIEHQRPMPKPGMIARFFSGYGFGLWIGLLVGLGIPHTVVEPRVWQRRMLLGTGNTKGRALVSVSRLFPALVIPRTRDGRADALLIAEYGRRHILAVTEAAS